MFQDISNRMKVYGTLIVGFSGFDGSEFLLLLLLLLFFFFSGLNCLCSQNICYEQGP